MEVANGKASHGCDLCNRTFSLRKTLLRHMRTVHKQAESFGCPQSGCSASFARQDIRDRHVATQHSVGTTRIVCPDCSKQIRPRALAEHRTTKSCRERQIRSDHARISQLKSLEASSLSTTSILDPPSDPLLVMTYLFLELADLGISGLSFASTERLSQDPPVEILRLRGLAYRTLSRSLKNRSHRQNEDQDLYHAISFLTTIDCIFEGDSALCRHVPALQTFGLQQQMVSLPVLRRSIDHFPRALSSPPDTSSVELSAVLAQQLSSQTWTMGEVPIHSTMLYSQLWSAKPTWCERARPLRSIIWVIQNFDNGLLPATGLVDH
nr:hypothetical protein CFP56_72127 [Quercus suber]